MSIQSDKLTAMIQIEIVDGILCNLFYQDQEKTATIINNTQPEIARAVETIVRFLNWK